MSKVVGIKIDTKSPRTREKIYYYKTNKDLKRGEVIRVNVPSGGRPTATIAIGNSKRMSNKNLKELKLDE